MTFEFALLIFLAATTLHNLEEAIWLPGWANATGRFHHAAKPFEFRFAVTALSVFALGLWVWAATSNTPNVANHLLVGYAVAMAGNALVPHVAISITTKRYMPGTFTGVALTLPAGVLVTYHGLSSEAVTIGQLAWIAPVVALGLLGAIIPLVKLGRRLGRTT